LIGMTGERRHTDRLELVALTAGLARETPDAIAGLLQAQLPSDGVPAIAAAWTAPGEAGWGTWLLILDDPPPRTWVGLASFQGPPGADGAVSLAVSVVPSCRRRGLATEACQELIDWALADPAVAAVAATAPTEGPAAVRLLARLQMTPGTLAGQPAHLYRRIGCSARTLPPPG
jgi:RimJ/RimL family protein N-acetyltransferase